MMGAVFNVETFVAGCQTALGDSQPILAERSMWTQPDYTEAPYDDTKVVGRGGIRDSRV